jgi:hypothetical protein
MVYDEHNQCLNARIDGIFCAVSIEAGHEGTIWIAGSELRPAHIKALQQFLDCPTVREIIDGMQIDAWLRQGQCD